MAANNECLLFKTLPRELFYRILDTMEPWDYGALSCTCGLALTLINDHLGTAWQPDVPILSATALRHHWNRELDLLLDPPSVSLPCEGSVDHLCVYRKPGRRERRAFQWRLFGR